MTDFLARLVSPSFGLAALTSFLGFVIPAAQALLVALVAVRVSWTGLARALPGSQLAFLLAELGAVLVKAIVLFWLLVNWTELATLVLEEGPRLAGLIVGSSVSAEQLAARMVAIAARFSETSLYGALDWLVTSELEAPSVSLTGSGEFESGAVLEETSGAPPSSGEQFATLVAVGAVMFAQVVAAAIAVMLALPKLLLLICLAVGPLALAAFVADARVTDELIEGWAETTLSAMLALPVMAVLVIFVSSAAIPDPTMSSMIGTTGQKPADVAAGFLDDLSLILLIGLLMAMVLPIASGLIQGRPPSARSFFGLILAACMLPLRSARLILALRPRSG